MRNVATNIARFENYVPTGASIQERLASLGAAILHWLLVGNTVGLMRLSIAESRRFPELASSVHRMARGRGLEAVGRLLAEAAQSAELGNLPAAPRASPQRPKSLWTWWCCRSFFGRCTERSSSRYALRSTRT
jgi:AefR-like transcriptional repressor, C-terminal domain